MQYAFKFTQKKSMHVEKHGVININKDDFALLSLINKNLIVPLPSSAFSPRQSV